MSSADRTTELVVSESNPSNFTVFFGGVNIGEVYPWPAGDLEAEAAYRRRFIGLPLPPAGVKGLWTHNHTDNFFPSRETAVAHLVTVYADEQDFEICYPAPKVESSHKWQVQVGAFGSAGTFDTEIEALRWVARHSPVYSVVEIVNPEVLQGAILQAIRKAEREESNIGEMLTPERRSSLSRMLKDSVPVRVNPNLRP